MKITHVLRGEDLLPSTPAAVGLYQSLIRVGVAIAPEFAHLPPGDGRRQQSCQKRDPQSNLFRIAIAAFCPKGCWIPGIAGLVDRRRPRPVHARRDGGGVRRPDVNSIRRASTRRPTRSTPNTFADWMSQSSPGDCGYTWMSTGTTPAWMSRVRGGGRIDTETRIVVLSDAWDLLKFFNDDAYEIDPKAASKELATRRHRSWTRLSGRSKRHPNGRRLRSKAR